MEEVGSNQSLREKLKSFDIENFFNEHKVPIALILMGLLLVGFGVLYNKNSDSVGSDKIEVLESVSESDSANLDIVVEVSGAVEKPGVYKLEKGARVNDAINFAGGFTQNIDNVWVEKFVNRASKLVDGQKLYFPSVDESLDGGDDQSEVSTATPIGVDQTDTLVLGSRGSATVNINTASKSELESLWGIGPVTAQNIIDDRMYSTVEELLEKGILKKNIYERNKDLLSVY